MRCPCCGKEMERGELRSRGGLYFLPEGEKTPLLYTEQEMQKRNAIYLPPFLGGPASEHPTAHVCRACTKMVVEYSL